jgi:hypothetical protein
MMLVESKPMINYKSMSKLLHFLDVKNFPKTQPPNIVGWEMSSCMHDVVVKKAKSLVEGASSSFLSFVMKS